MHITAAILLLILEGVPSMFSGEMEWIMTVSMLNLQGVVLLFLVLNPPDKKNIIARSLFLVFLVYKIIDYSLNIPHAFYGYDIYLKSYQVTAGICLIMFLYNLFKSYDHPSDTIKDDSSIYLCFWKPTTLKTLSPTLLGFPFGGMSIYSQGILYGFRWSKDTYQIDHIKDNKTIQDNFTIHDTKISMNTIIFTMLQNLEGAKAGRLRIRCISIIKPVLNLMGSKYRVSGLFGMIPSLKAAEILG